jgi:hypothetical protein
MSKPQPTFTEETQRPSEWLRRLEEDHARYPVLLDESGGFIGIAAYRIARARCRTRAAATIVPTMHELRAAAEDIARRCRVLCPMASHLVEECRRSGLLVITPISTDRAA